MRLIDLIQESRFESGGGSSSGRSGFSSKEAVNRERLRSTKGRVKIFPSIAKALAALEYGQIFSTISSNRLYVITKPTWGDKSRSGGNNKVAKGFAAGTPFTEIKSYSSRTMHKHGATNDK